ncbi:MAG: hypothetical protein ACJ8GN_24830 [Longimicrobiaceae bacterium]
MLSFVQRFRLVRSMVRLAVRTEEEPEDPWLCIEFDVPWQLLGSGSVHDFPWYFEGDSAVPVTSFDEVCSFLLGCTYAHDEDLFQVPDFWQHPVTFEQLRKGDCEDHALWAWRKLRELGCRAHLVTGSSVRHDPDRGTHAWVIFHGDGGLYLFETTAKVRERMVRPLDDVRGQYLPFFSVDESFTIFLYDGFGRYLLDRRGARKLPPPGVLDLAAGNPGG